MTHPPDQDRRSRWRHRSWRCWPRSLITSLVLIVAGDPVGRRVEPDPVAARAPASCVNIINTATVLYLSGVAVASASG